MPSKNFAKPFVDTTDTSQTNLPNLIKELIGKKDNEQSPEKMGKDHNQIRTIADRMNQVRQHALNM